MKKTESRKKTFIDFALYILNTEGDELARLNNEWKTALSSSEDPVEEIRKFAKREEFSFGEQECRDALEFWNKFMEANPNCETGCPDEGGPVMY